MYRTAASNRLVSAPTAVADTTGRPNPDAVEDRVARSSLFRLAAAWRACPKAQASLPDEGAGPLFEAATANDASHASSGRLATSARSHR